NLRELDLPKSEGEDLSGHWLSHFLDACTLESLNMSCLSSERLSRNARSLRAFLGFGMLILTIF
nr:hypothetical protein [Tanacetum cinerariifolium]